jgi:hypothetical protein
MLTGHTMPRGPHTHPTATSAAADTFGPPGHDGRLPTEDMARVAGAIALAAVAIIHVLDLPDTLRETPLIGYSYFLLIGAAMISAVVLLAVRAPHVWVLADLVAASAIVAYVLSRTTGLPTDPFDIGNWDCSLGTAALSTETLIVLLAAWRMRPRDLLPVARLRNGLDRRADVAPPVSSPH